jgi:2'-5' RNA ligase
VRLFVAVWPPPEVLDALARLDRPAVPGVRWTRRESRHVTLWFLGEVDDPAPLAAALDAAPLGPAEAEVGPRVTSFGREVLVVPVAGLEGLASAVAEAPAVRQSVGGGLRFRGHITLARARRGGDVRSLRGTRVAARFPVGEVMLVRSTPGAGGHRYDVLHARPLG